MNCTTTTHIWLWFGAGTGSACDDHVRCQCGAYTYGEWHSLRNENARLTALLAERDAEIARLGEAGRDAIDCLERALGAQRPYSLTRTQEIRLVLDTLRAALAGTVLAATERRGEL